MSNKQLTEDDFIKAGMGAAERKKAAKLEEDINNDGVISAASLPDEYQIKDPFDPEFLMGLPKEVLVKIIETFQQGHQDFVKLCHNRLVEFDRAKKVLIKKKKAVETRYNALSDELENLNALSDEFKNLADSL